jgi:predicted ATP-dependent endonuclease of OLD family
MEENRKNVFKAKEQSIDENLMIEFLQEIRRIKEVFKKYGGTFETIIKSFSQEIFSFKTLLQNIQLVLKGTYKIDQYGEKILLNNEQYVYLKNASSGQKEVIRILQDAVLCILENQNAFRVVEEPEAHLFPVAQKQLVESLIFMKNYNPLNQLIITTHSPYILTVLNNLLFATRVVSTKPESLDEVATIIPQEFHIKPNEFAAYSLGNSLLQDATYCENIINEKTGMIKQNYLDTVSDMLGGDFNFLYQLHSQNLKPR